MFHLITSAYLMTLCGAGIIFDVTVSHAYNSTCILLLVVPPAMNIHELCTFVLLFVSPSALYVR